jgi:hypothetical protein
VNLHEAARRLCAAAFVGVILSACTRIGDPTLLPLPQDAIDARHVASAAGRVSQTDFTLEAAYPDGSAARHYAQRLSRPWPRCEAPPRWQRLQERGATVHQQAHAWIDRETRRTIQVFLRYATEGERAERPAYPIQHVIVLEHLGVDVDAEVRRLGLACPPVQ